MQFTQPFDHQTSYVSKRLQYGFVKDFRTTLYGFEVIHFRYDTDYKAPDKVSRNMCYAV